MQLFHVFEHTLMFNVRLPLLLSNVLDQAAKHAILIEQEALEAGQE